MTVIQVDANPKNATSDPDSGLRFYRWMDRDLPSVTSIRRIAGIPHPLHQWAISQVVHRAVDEFETLERMLTRPEILDAQGKPTEKGLKRPRRPREVVLHENRSKEAGSWLRRAATEKRDAAAALGTAVHDAAAKGVRPHRLLPEYEVKSGRSLVIVTADQIRPRLRQYYSWLEERQPTIIASEAQVFNLRIGYGGTFDLLVVMPDDRIFLVDLKTGTSTYTEHALQLVAYSMAEFVGQDDVINKPLTKWLHKIDGMAVLHLSDTGWKWQEVKPSVAARLWGAFKGLYQFALFFFENPKIDSLLEEEYEGHDEL